MPAVKSPGCRDMPVRSCGTYKGPLARIVSRLLRDYNFVVQTSSDGVQATVLDNSSATAVPGLSIARPSATAAPSLPIARSSATAVPGLPMPWVERPAPAAVQEDPTIAGQRRVLPTVQQNQGGQRRIDMTQPPQDKPPTALDNSSATVIPGLPIPGVERPAPATIR